MYVPSAMTVWRLASGGAMRGRMRQHHAIRLRRARASPAESAALWDDGPSSQERNSSSVRSRLRRRCGIVELNRQAGHFHRVLLQCLLGGFGSVFPQCGLMVFPGVVIVSR